MIERKGIADTPREHFRRAAEEEMEKFVRKEIAIQQAERIERALVLAEFETSDPAISQAPTEETMECIHRRSSGQRRPSHSTESRATNPARDRRGRESFVANARRHLS